MGFEVKQTYEIIRPETVGIPEGNLHLTSRSGRHVIKHRLQKLGYKEAMTTTLRTSIRSSSSLQTRKVASTTTILKHYYFCHRNLKTDIASITSAMSGSGIIPTATVTISRGGEEQIAAAKGNGPIEAVFRAIDQVTGLNLKLDDYQIHSQALDDALGQVAIIASLDGKKYHGVSYSTDIVEASAHAYVNVINTCIQALKSSEVNNRQRLNSQAKAESASI